MYDPYRIGPIRQNYYYQRKGSVLRRKFPQTPQPDWKKQDLEPLVPLFLKNHWALPYIRPTPPQVYIDYFSIYQKTSSVAPLFEPVDIPQFQDFDIGIDTLNYSFQCNDETANQHFFILIDPDRNPGQLYINSVYIDFEGGHITDFKGNPIELFEVQFPVSIEVNEPLNDSYQYFTQFIVDSDITEFKPEIPFDIKFISGKSDKEISLFSEFAFMDNKIEFKDQSEGVFYVPYITNLTKQFVYESRQFEFYIQQE